MLIAQQKIEDRSSRAHCYWLFINIMDDDVRMQIAQKNDLKQKSKLVSQSRFLLHSDIAAWKLQSCHGKLLLFVDDFSVLTLRF